jgi:hypothetical protein
MPSGNVCSHAELEGLTERVNELERRLSALEHPSQAPPRGVALPLASEPAQPGFADTSVPPTQASVLSLAGVAILGIAGAYVLRAVAESGVLPSWIAVTLALAYAAAWLVWAARPRASHLLARYFYVCTAALILVPLLWETTVRFQTLSPPLAAAVLAAFAVLATALAWRADLSVIAWVGTSTTVVTAVVLMVATRVFVPFTLSLLAIALLTELSAIKNRWLGLRPVVAAAADFAVFILVLILGNSSAVPAEYRPVAAPPMIAIVAVLFAIYAVSLSIRSLVLELPVSIPEAAQLAAVVLLAGWSVLRITDGSGRLLLGVCFLLFGAGCYFAAFGSLAQRREHRNFRFYAACAVSLVIAGSFLALSPVPLVTWLCVAALAATALGVRARSAVLDLHGVAYLSAAVVASGLLGYAGRALAGAYPPPPGPLPIAAAVAAVLCAAMVSRYSGERVLRLLPALLAAYETAALAVAALVSLVTRGASPAHPQLAAIRTVVTCAVVLLLAFLGGRWKRGELVWIAYAVIVLGSVKLALEDLRVGTTRSLAVSLLLYGAVLILIPRFVRSRKRLA